MATYYEGTDGDVTFGSVTLNTQEWSFTDEGTIKETTHKSGGGFYDSITTKRKGSGNIKAIWDGDIEYGSPPNLRSGSTGSATLLLGNESGSPSITGTIRVISCAYSHTLDGAFEYDLSFETNGSYLVPGEEGE